MSVMRDMVLGADVRCGVVLVLVGAGRVVALGLAGGDGALCAWWAAWCACYGFRCVADAMRVRRNSQFLWLGATVPRARPLSRRWSRRSLD